MKQRWLLFHDERRFGKLRNRDVLARINCANITKNHDGDNDDALGLENWTTFVRTIFKELKSSEQKGRFSSADSWRKNDMLVRSRQIYIYCMKRGRTSGDYWQQRSIENHSIFVLMIGLYFKVLKENKEYAS